MMWTKLRFLIDSTTVDWFNISKSVLKQMFSSTYQYLVFFSFNCYSKRNISKKKWCKCFVYVNNHQKSICFNFCIYINWFFLSLVKRTNAFFFVYVYFGSPFGEFFFILKNWQKLIEKLKHKTMKINFELKAITNGQKRTSL